MFKCLVSSGLLLFVVNLCQVFFFFFSILFFFRQSLRCQMAEGDDWHLKRNRHCVEVFHHHPQKKHGGTAEVLTENKSVFTIVPRVGSTLPYTDHKHTF